MGTDADHGPVGRGLGVRQGRALAADGAEPGVDQVRVRAAVAAPLGEREVPLLLAVDALGREPLDWSGEEVGVVGNLDPPGDLRLGQAAGVNDRILVLDLLPLKALLAAVSIEAFAILPGD